MRHFLFHLVLAVFIASLASSCNTNGEYVKHGGTICYSYWTFSFGTIYDTLPGVDAASFTSIENWLGRDKQHSYFKGRLIEGAHPASLKAKKYPLSCDNNDYYYMHKPLKVASVKHFEVIKWNEDDMWAIDNRYAYYDSIRIDGTDLATFKIQAHNVATDRNHVYRYGKIMPLADPATYVEQWNGLYSRDKGHIWYCGKLMEDVDIATFVIDKDGARDKNGHFYRGERVSNEQWQEIATQRSDDEDN